MQNEYEHLQVPILIYLEQARGDTLPKKSQQILIPNNRAVLIYGYTIDFVYLARNTINQNFHSYFLRFSQLDNFLIPLGFSSLGNLSYENKWDSTRVIHKMKNPIKLQNITFDFFKLDLSQNLQVPFTQLNQSAQLVNNEIVSVQAILTLLVR